MTKKDYELIAGAIRASLKDNVSIKSLVEFMSIMLQEENHKFNRQKFLIACGVVEEITEAQKVNKYMTSKGYNGRNSL